ncbi:unnamed protein product [Gongylonema pulchrum]|uniref:Transposase n=1 Tax=Gongylonema pulchrum TaxID=637853 RepID=A0A183D3E4_9BILA|nr:unnamed protein product [Gongylonema pulchrum]
MERKNNSSIICDDREAAVCLLAIRSKTAGYKQPVNRVFWDFETEQKLAQAKNEIDEQAHQNRLDAIRKRLEIENQDCWYRPSAYYWMGLKDH